MKVTQALNLNILGLVAIGQGDLQQAIKRLTAGLELSQDLGDKRVIVQCLEGFAWLACWCKDLARAARLFAANESLRALIGLPLPIADQSDNDHYLGMTRTQLDKVTLEAAWAEGKAMTMEQAIGYALKPCT